MKKIMFVLTGIILQTACSPPKQVHEFDYRHYNSGKKPAKEGLLADQDIFNPANDVIENKAMIAGTK